MIITCAPLLPWLKLLANVGAVLLANPNSKVGTSYGLAKGGSDFGVGIAVEY